MSWILFVQTALAAFGLILLSRDWILGLFATLALQCSIHSATIANQRWRPFGSYEGPDKIVGSIKHMRKRAL